MCDLLFFCLSSCIYVFLPVAKFFLFFHLLFRFCFTLWAFPQVFIITCVSHEWRIYTRWMNTQFILLSFSSNRKTQTHKCGIRCPRYFKRQSSTYYFNMMTTTTKAMSLFASFCVCVRYELRKTRNTFKWDSVTNSHKDLRLHFCNKVFLFFFCGMAPHKNAGIHYHIREKGCHIMNCFKKSSFLVFTWMVYCMVIQKI